MWNVFPKLGLAKIVLFLLCIIVTVCVIWATEGWIGLTDFFAADGFTVLISILTPVLVIFVAVTWFLGTILWRWIWQIPVIGDFFNQKVCPDLNGSWIGKVVSTYNNTSIEKEVEMEIKASFFGFDMRLVSTDGYQRSTVMQSEIMKDPRDGSFYLSYIFESVVDQPKNTDQPKFDGAARLHIRFENDRIKLIGVYWTNRGWQKQDQTAGTIFLERTVK